MARVLHDEMFCPNPLQHPGSDGSMLEVPDEPTPHRYVQHGRGTREHPTPHTESRCLLADIVQQRRPAKRWRSVPCNCEPVLLVRGRLGEEQRSFLVRT